MIRYLLSVVAVLALLVPSFATAAPLKTLQNAATATGDGTTFDVADNATVGLTVSGTFVGTITFKGTSDSATNWLEIYCTRTDTNVSATATTTTGQFLCPTAGLTGLIADITAYTSGSITVTAYGTKAGGVSTGGGVDTGLLTSLVAIFTDIWDSVLHAFRVTLATLISGEDQTNNLMMTSGGIVRKTQIVGTGGVPSTATNATTSAQVLPTGKKTFHGLVTCTGSCVQTQAIYGAQESSATVAKSKLVCTIEISGTTTATDFCVTDWNFSYWFVVTTLTGGTTPLASLMVMY